MKEVKTPAMWAGRRILHPDHAVSLDMAAAKHEFGAGVTREQAEAKAYDDYVRGQRLDAAAHHLAGMKAARAAGDASSAQKHGAMYDAHLKAVGLEPIGPVPPEVQSRLGTLSGQYRFKAHSGDLLTLTPEQHNG